MYPRIYEFIAITRYSTILALVQSMYRTHY